MSRTSKTTFVFPRRYALKTAVASDSILLLYPSPVSVAILNSANLPLMYTLCIASH